MKTIILSLMAAAGAVGQQVDWVSQVRNKPVADTRQYNFSPQAQTSTIAGGSTNQVAHFAHCPLGVNGTDVAHYLYISTVGTPEAVLITGGTCTAGAATGTVLFTPQYAHATGWTIGSATGGIAEAVIAAPAGSTIAVNSAITAYAPTTISKNLTVQGLAGVAITASGSLNAIFVVASDHVVIRDCTLAAGSAATYAVTNSGTHTDILLDHNTITGANIAVYFTAGTYLSFTRNNVSGFTNGGICAQVAVTINYLTIAGNFVSSVGSTVLNGVAIAAWGSHTSITGNIVRIGGNADQGIVALGSYGAGHADLIISNNLIEVAGVNAFECVGVGGIAGFIVSGNTCYATVVVSGTSPLYGFEISGSAYGTVTGNSFYGNDSTTIVSGIPLLSSSNVSVVGNMITGYGASVFSSGIVLLVTSVGQPVSNNVVSANVLTQTAGTSTGTDLLLDSQVAGTMVNNTFSGNSITGTTATGHVCIQLANSGGATSSGHVVQNNSLTSCDTGVRATGTAIKVSGNTLRTTTVPYALFTAGTFLQDSSTGIAFAAIPSNAANGSAIYVSDANAGCTAGSSTGQQCVKVNGTWIH